MSAKTIDKYPAGAIRRPEEVYDLKRQCAEDRRPIRIYAVGQLGYLEEFAITRKCNTSRSHGSVFIEMWLRFGGNWHKSKYSLMDRNIPANHYNDHFLFTNRMLAEKYATNLKSNKAHIDAVHAHWKRCDKMFGSLY